MAFDFNNVTNTCTCGHVTEMDYHVGNERLKTPPLKLKALREFRDTLRDGNNSRGMKLFMATLTGQQLEADGYFAKELLESTGWVESARGPIYDGVREDDTGDLTIWTVSPPVFYEQADIFEKALVAQIEELKKKPIEKEEISRRQAYPEFKAINLKKDGLIHEDTLLDDTIAAKRLVSAEAILVHIKLKYGLDFRDVFPIWTAATFRQIKTHHADWRAGRK